MSIDQPHRAATRAALEAPFASRNTRALPADAGLTAVGLIMQLVGGVSLLAMTYLMLLPIFGPMPGAFSVFLLGLTGAVRAMFHRAAGSALLYGGASGVGSATRATHIYLVVAVAESSAWLALLINVGVATTTAIPLAAVLLAWPAVVFLAIIRPPRFRNALDALPARRSEDLGYEGVGVLLLILGATGLLVAAMVVLSILKMPSALLTSPPGLIVTGVFVVLGARSVTQFLAGIKATAGADIFAAAGAAARYTSFGIVSSVVAAAALLVMMLTTRISGVGLVVVGIVTWALLIWPLVLKRFYTEKNFSLELAENETRGRAPDRGMTTLGWLLLGLGAVGVAFGVMQLIGINEPSPFGDLLRSKRTRLAQSQSPLWGIGLSGLQLWAGFELTRMSERFRLSANVYGAVATVATIYLSLSALSGIRLTSGVADGIAGLMSIVIYVGLAISLVVPITTLVLVNRPSMR